MIPRRPASRALQLLPGFVFMAALLLLDMTPAPSHARLLWRREIQEVGSGGEPASDGVSSSSGLFTSTTASSEDEAVEAIPTALSAAEFADWRSEVEGALQAVGAVWAVSWEHMQDEDHNRPDSSVPSVTQPTVSAASAMPASSNPKPAAFDAANGKASSTVASGPATATASRQLQQLTNTPPVTSSESGCGAEQVVRCINSVPLADVPLNWHAAMLDTSLGDFRAAAAIYMSHSNAAAAPVTVSAGSGAGSASDEPPQQQQAPPTANPVTLATSASISRLPQVRGSGPM
jgi:hypothetical protein